MEEKISNGPPSGLTPIIVVKDAVAAADFYIKAFNAVEIARIASPNDDRLLHVRLHIFGSTLVLMDQFPELSGKGSGFRSPDFLSGTSATLHLQVDDAIKVWEQVISAGAQPLVPMEKQFWGEYYGRLKDPFGHEWTIAQMIDHLSDEEVANAAKVSLKI